MHLPVSENGFLQIRHTLAFSLADRSMKLQQIALSVSKIDLIFRHSFGCTYMNNMASSPPMTMPAFESIYIPGRSLRVELEKRSCKPMTQVNTLLQNCPNPPCQGTRSLETVDGLSVCARCGRQSEDNRYVEGPTFQENEWEDTQVAKYNADNRSTHFENVKYESQKHRACHAKADSQFGIDNEAIKRRMKLARRKVHEHFAQRCQIPEPVMMHTMNLLEQLLQKHNRRINNLLSAVCACMIVATEQRPNDMPLDVHSIITKRGVTDTNFELYKSVKRFLKLLRQTLDIEPPTLAQRVTRWVGIFQRQIGGGKLPSPYLRRIEAQLNNTLEDLQTEPKLQRRTPETIAAAVICLALRSFHVEHGVVTKKGNSSNQAGAVQRKVTKVTPQVSENKHTTQTEQNQQLTCLHMCFRFCLL